MKNSLLLSLIVALSVVGSASATTRVLTCSNNQASFSVGTCGTPTGCTASITIGSAAAKTYSVVRSRNTSGNFVYSPRGNSHPKCTTTLRTSNKYIASSTCATQLKGAKCSVVTK